MENGAQAEICGSLEEKRASHPSLLQDQDVWELQLAVLLPKQAEFAVVFETEIKVSTNSFNG